jgi:hypothetical protein
LALLWPQRYRLEGLVQTDLLGSLLITRSLSLDVLGAVVAIPSWSPPPTICSSTGNGASARKCRFAR